MKSGIDTETCVRESLVLWNSQGMNCNCRVLAWKSSGRRTLCFLLSQKRWQLINFRRRENKTSLVRELLFWQLFFSFLVNKKYISNHWPSFIIQKNFRACCYWKTINFFVVAVSRLYAGSRHTISSFMRSLKSFWNVQVYQWACPVKMFVRVCVFIVIQWKF